MEVIVIDEAAISTMARRQPNLSREMGKLIEVRKDAIALAKRRSRNEKRPQQKPQPELPDDLDYDVDISAVKLVKDANHNGKHPTKNAERNSKQIKQSE
jgi:hypothetical protein